MVSPGPFTARAVAAVGGACVLAALQWIGLFVLGIMFRSASPRGALAGILAAVIFTAWATFTAVTIPSLRHPLMDLATLNYGWNVKLIGVLSSLILLAVGLPTSFLLGGPRGDATELTVWESRNKARPAGAVTPKPALLAGQEV
jgi:hypothetical protein